jgi:DNA-binding response OmpR family regulator
VPDAAPPAERVLILEDDPDTLESLAELLRMDGLADVRTAHTAVEAERELSLGFLPSAVLLDLWLGLDDGETFAKRLKTDPVYSAVPIIALSGDALSLRRIEGLVDAGFLKPFDLVELVSALRKVWERGANAAVTAAATPPA